MNKRLIFTTICVGDEPWKDHKHACLLLINSVLERTKYSICVVTDDISFFEKWNFGERVLLYDIQKYTDQPLFFLNFFNCNLKYIPIKIAFEFECDYTIYADCDTLLNSWDDMHLDVFDKKDTDVYAPYGDSKVGNPSQRQSGNYHDRMALDKYNEIGELWDDSMQDGPLIQETNILFKRNKEKQDIFISTFEKIAANSIKYDTQKTFESYFFGASMGMAKMKFENIKNYGTDPPSYHSQWNLIHTRQLRTMSAGVIKDYDFDELLNDIKTNRVPRSLEEAESFKLNKQV